MVRLYDGKPQADAVGDGETNNYLFDVPTSFDTIDIVVTTFEGDADLFASFNDTPTKAHHQFSSLSSFGDDQITVSSVFGPLCRRCDVYVCVATITARRSLPTTTSTIQSASPASFAPSALPCTATATAATVSL